MKPRVFAFILVFAATIFSAFAQSSGQSSPQGAQADSSANQSPSPKAGPDAPAEPEILLPAMILDIEDVSVQSVSSALPAPAELAVPNTTVPLPDQGDLHIPESAFDIATPNQGTGATAQRPEGATLFSTGVLGAGSSDHILGSVSLFKLGESPKFRLGFSHEGMDGYAGEKAGTGFFSASNNINGWLSLGKDAGASMQTQAVFNESETGLQKISSYYSAKVQTLDGSVDFSLHPDDLVTLGGTVDGDLATRLFSAAGGGTSAARSEYRVSPSLTASLNLPSVNADLATSYDLRMTDALPTLNTLAAGLSIDATLPATLVLKLDGGINWPVGDLPSFPFGIDFSGTLFQALTVDLSGGYELIPQRLSLFWPDFPVLSTADVNGSPLVDASEWFGKLDLSWNTPDQALSGEGAVKVAYREGVMNILGYTGVGSTGLYDYRLDSMLTLMPSLRLRWDPLSTVSLTLGWTGNLMNKTNQEAWNTFSFELGANSPANRFGGSLRAVMNMYDTPSLPELDATAHLDVSDGVQFQLDAQDLLAPIISDKRPVIGTAPSAAFPFLQPGLRVTLSTHISL